MRKLDLRVCKGEERGVVGWSVRYTLITTEVLVCSISSVTSRPNTGQFPTWRINVLGCGAVYKSRTGPILDLECLPHKTKVVSTKRCRYRVVDKAPSIPQPALPRGYLKT
jgi:hypothetical protein